MNIAAPLVEMARRQPSTPALICPKGNGWLGKKGQTQVSYRELDEESDRLARGLARLGMRRGMRTALMVPPSLEFYALTFGLFKLGCVVVLIDPGMGVLNLGACLTEAEPEAFLGIARAHAGRVILGWSRRTVRLCVTVGGGRLFWKGWNLEEVREEGKDGAPVLTETDDEEMAAILFTSGSTGVAKGAVYTHGIFSAQVEMLRKTYGIEPGEIDLPTFPLFGLFAPALGMTAVLPEMNFTKPGSVDPAAILTPVQQRQVTNLFGSPALLRRVAMSPEATGVRLNSIRRVISAGAPVSPKVIRKVVELLPPGVQVHTPYGATEALPVSTIGSDEILGETGAQTFEGKGICVGRPIEGMTVRILRIQDDPIPEWVEGLEVPSGEIGEITVSGPVVTRSYYNRPESTALHKMRDGDRVWHRMGDVGYLDERGRIWFCGRKSHRVVTPAGTYFTIPVEGVFNAHPAVYRTALVGVKRNGIVEPELCIELDPEVPRPDLETLRRELAALGAKYSHTKVIRRFHVHRRFPVDIRHNAKIFRERLAMWAARQSGGLVQ